jgi:hypothetical protein
MTSSLNPKPLEEDKLLLATEVMGIQALDDKLTKP